MHRIYTTNIWSTLSRQINKASSKKAAIAFVSSPNLVKFRAGDMLICNASDTAIKLGETSAKTLKLFFDKGVSLYSHSSLHAKSIIFDNMVLVGSNNLSLSSDSQLMELALLTDSTTVRSQIMAFLHSLKSEAKKIDKSFLTRILKLPVSKRIGKGNGGKAHHKQNIYGNKFWIMTSIVLNEDRYKNEAPLAEAACEDVSNEYGIDKDDVSWIRLAGASNFRKKAMPGDTVIEVHTCGKRNTKVYHPVAILKKQSRSKWTRLYYETQSESEALSWTQFSTKLKKLGISSIKKNRTKELTGNQSVLVNSIWRK